jgi:DNA-binding GntR family transcriptional regulator
VNELMNGSAMSKARQAFVKLREQILDGRLPPGSRLTLRPIAKSLGVNVGAVSEAVRELVHEQLVDFEPNYGARVKKLDLETMRSQHVLRIAIECEAIRRCTDRLNARGLDELDRMAEEVDRLVDVEERLSEARQADLQFHLKIADLSGVPSLVYVLRSCHLVRLLAIESASSLLAVQIANRTHVELVDAIRSRDPDVAESAMREHCERSLFLQLQMTFGAVARS